MGARFRLDRTWPEAAIGLGPESESDCSATGISRRKLGVDWGRVDERESRRHQDRGSVTVEAALVLPALVLVLVLCLAGIGCLTAQLRCVDAAREAARLAGRGDVAAARSAALSIAPEGASVSIEETGDLVRVTVSAGPFGGLLPGVRVSATSVAAAESVVGRSP